MFNSNEIEQLKCFSETCSRIAACRFIAEFSKQSHHIFVGKLPDGRIMDEYPRYDDDDFRAFLTHYRKLRAEREKGNLNRVINLLKREGDDGDRKELDYFKSEIAAEGRSWWGVVRRDENGDKHLLTQVELENLILNGDVFHSDMDKRMSLAQVIGKVDLMKAVAFSNYMRFARTVVSYAQKTADLIQKRGYLTGHLAE